MAAKVDEKMSDLAQTWKEANSRVDTRRENLHSGLQFHQFVHDCKEFQTWLLDLDKRIKSVAAPNFVAEAAAFMSLHQERKADLGLIWTIIVRFQIQEIEIDVDDDETASGKTTEKMSAKEALLLWCQRRTNGYQHVDIKDFSLSWQNGLGFNFLIHHYRPDLINFTKLNEDAHLDNLRNAFDVADKHLGIPQLFDPEDIDVSKPNEKSVLTISPPTTTPLPR